MADNVLITPGIGATVAADDIAGVLHQRVKIEHGADGSATDVSAASPLPVVTTNAGTFATQITGAALTALELIDNVVALEDNTAGTGYAGIPALCVRQDAQSALAADGDFISPTVDASGGLRVSIVAGGGGSGGTALQDDAAFTPGTTNITPVGGTYRSVRDSVDDNDAGALAMTQKRSLLVALDSPNGDSCIDDTLDAVKVSIVGDSVGSAVDTEDGTVAAGTTLVALTIGQEYEFDGTNWTRQTGMHVTAHDAADAGNPPKIGAKATTSISALTMVATADRTNLFAGIDGVLIVRPHCNLEDNLTGTASNIDGTSTAVIAAQAAGIKTYLTMLDLYNSSAAAVVVELKDGTTVKKSFLVPAGGGLIRRFEPPLAGTAATAWNFDPAGATTTIYCNGEGFRSKV